jgi:formylmethanofuran dehydrogenase subunit E-like metal-binding protein
MVRFGVVILLMMALLPKMALGDEADMYQLGTDAANYAMGELGFEKGDENVLVLTDAGYAMIDGQTTEKAIKGLTENCGCNIGDGNLLMIQRSKFNPLWFFFYNKATGEALFLQVEEDADLSGENVFEIDSKETIAYEDVMENQDAWGQKFNDKVFGGNEFSLITIANVWALPETSYETLQASCFHNHLCPGIPAAHMIANYVEKELPIESSSQSYKVIACPVWCKDDYFQVVWDATSGKYGLYAKQLSDDEVNALTEKYGVSPVGIYIRWDSSTDSGDGLVVGFDWDKTYELTGTANWTGNSMLQYLKMDVEMAKFVDSPETVVSTIKAFQLNSTAEFNVLASAGVNPLKVLGVEV